jgi:hypothetical protein
MSSVMTGPTGKAIAIPISQPLMPTSIMELPTPLLHSSC